MKIAVAPASTIDHVDRVARLVDLMGAGSADLHTQRKAYLALRLTLPPSLVQQRHQPGLGGADLRIRVGDARLNPGIVAQR